MKTLFVFQILAKLCFALFHTCKVSQVLKSHQQDIHCDSRHSCEVLRNYNALQTVHFSFSHGKQASLNFLLKIVLFHFSMVDCKIFNNKIPEMKRSHFSIGSQLTSQTDHFYLPARSLHSCLV